MATLMIEGRRIKVDDAFRNLSPEDQDRTARQIASSIGVGSTPAADGDGLAMNTTAGLNEGIYGTLGVPVDLARGAINLGIRGFNAATGGDFGTIPSNSPGGSEWIAERMGGIHPALDPGNTVAATQGERIARGGGQGVGYALAPEATFAAASRAGMVSGRLADAGGAVFGRSASPGAVAGNAVAGGGAGGGAVAAGEAAPENWKPLAALGGGLAAGGAATLATGVPALTRAGAGVAGDLVAPMTPSGRERIAGQQLLDNATDPSVLRGALDEGVDEMVPGSRPTTFQQIGDMGIGALERGAQAKRPELFNTRRAEQNTARIRAMEGVQPTGSPEAVASAVRTRLQQIDNETQKALDEAVARARGGGEDLGPGVSPAAAGDRMRGALETARATAKEREQSLWEAVDPDGRLALSAGNTRRQATSIREQLPASAKPPAGEEAAIYSVLNRYGDIVPFSELTALQSRLKAEMRAERIANGDTPAYRRMSQLNGAIHQDLESAVAGKAAAQAQAVARGELDADQTIAAAFQRQVDAWREQRQDQTRAALAEGVGSPPARGSAPVRSGSRSQSQSGGGFSDPPRDPRLSADAANFDEVALGRLNEARQTTTERVGTFDNKVLAPIRRRPSTTSPYDMPPSVVPQRIFFSGQKSSDAIRAFRTAVGDDHAEGALTGYIVDRLRAAAMRADGTLDPAKVTAFRRSHRDALRSFPALDRRIADASRASETVTEVLASRNAALDAAQKGKLGALLGLDDPQDVTRVIGSIFARQDSIQQMVQLRRAIGNDKEATNGLRKAIADYVAGRFVGNTEAGTSGLGTMKSDQFQTFIRQNARALRAADFSESEVRLMQAVADDLQRANRSIASVKNPGGSNTAQDALQVQRGDSAPTILSKVLVGAAAGGGAIAGGWIPAALGAVGAQLATSLRMNGIETIDELVADALLNPDRARMLISKVKPREVKKAATSLAQRYRRAAMAVVAVSANQQQARERSDAR